ncbi:MAG: hypothetical protein RL264_1462 [Bacteroidota bacterium]|jgi:hypothetical protein
MEKNDEMVPSNFPKKPVELVEELDITDFKKVNQFKIEIEIAKIV